MSGIIFGGGITIGGGITVQTEGSGGGGGGGGSTLSWNVEDGGNMYADSEGLYIVIAQVSSSSIGSALDLYNAVSTGVLVAGTPVTFTESGAMINDPPNTSYLVLASGFTYNPEAGGGGGGWVSTITVTSGTATANMGISAVFQIA